MSLRTWFLGAATIGRSAAARYADVAIEDFRAAADDLGYGSRLTFPQIEEVIASLGDPDDDDEEPGDDDEEEDDGEDSDEEDQP